MDNYTTDAAVTQAAVSQHSISGGVAAVHLIYGNKSTTPSLKSKDKWNKRSKETRTIIKGLNTMASRQELDDNIGRATVLRNEAAALSRCGALEVHKCMECGELAGRRGENVVLGRRVVYQCHSRLCAYCNNIRGELQAKRLAGAVAGAQYPVKVELTVRNGPDLAERLDHLMDCFGKFTRSKAFREAFRGGAAVVEVTIDAAGNWHPHLHMVLDGRMDQRLLSELWHKITGDSYIVHITKIKEEWQAGAIRYILKYPFKVSGLLGRMDMIEEFLRVMKGRRLIRTFGTFYNADEEKVLDTDIPEEVIPEEEEGSAIACPHCGVPGYMKYIRGFWVERWRGVRLSGGWYIWNKEDLRATDNMAREPSLLPAWLGISA